MTMFEFPIGIQLFNRPDYAEKLLISLNNQTLQVQQESLHILIDGFSGSSYEKRGEQDRTREVYEIAKAIFPNALVESLSTNLGIAGLHTELQELTFAKTETWAAFFEEDLILDASYLAELASLIEIVTDNQKIAKVACFQIISTLVDLPRGYSGFYPGRGTKAFAERKSFFKLKLPMMKSFIEILNSKSEDMNNNDDIVVQDSLRLATLASYDSLGVLINSMDHDIATDLFIEFKGLLHVVTKPNLATDIGVVGIHNSTTPRLELGNLVKDSATQEERKVIFERSVNSIAHEATAYTKQNFKKILDGYYISLSSKKMVKKILRNIIARISGFKLKGHR